MNAQLAPLALNDEDRQSLSQVLGVPEDVLILPESEFAAHFGCSAQSIEIMLETEWVQHDIQAVLAGTEKVGCQPWLLLNEQNRTVRLFSPSSAALLADAYEEIELSAQFEKPGQAPVSASHVLAWWEHVEQARKLFMDACRVGRAHDWGKDQAAAIQRVTAIETLIPTLISRRLLDVKSQSNSIEKCSVLCCELATYWGDVANIRRLTELITHDKRLWAALGEALVDSRWLDSDSPLAYLNRTTRTIYGQVRPDSGGRDSQGMHHQAGQGRRIEPTDALHRNNRGVPIKRADPFDCEPPQNDGDSLEKMLENYISEPVWSRVLTESSLRALEERAREDPLLTDYLRAVTGNPKKKRADIWRELGWNEQQGKAVDRKYRRLCKLLKAKGVGMEWREAPVPGSDASKLFFFEVLHDAKGNRFGMYQHKPLKTKGK